MRFDFIGPSQSMLGFTQGGVRTQVDELDESDLVAMTEFYKAQIREFEDERRRHEPRWDHAINAFRNKTEVQDEDFPFFSEVEGDAIIAGLPYAATMTNVAALTPSSVLFEVKPKRESARRFANVCQAILNATWNTDERQRLIEKLIMCCRHTGLMIGMGVYETDYDEWQRRMEEQAAKDEEGDDENAEYLRGLDALIEEEMRKMRMESESGAVNRLRAEADHTIRWEEPGIMMIKPHDYVADPNADDLVWGPRWEGRRVRGTLKELRENPRYDQTVIAQISPHIARYDEEGSAPDRFRRRRNRSRFRGRGTPASHQIVEWYELYVYDARDYKDQGGALISIHPDCDRPMEIRANPYGRRAFVVEEWNGTTFEPFPQSDFDAWKEIWSSMQDIFYRMVRGLRKAGNGTVIIDDNSTNNRDEVEGVIENDDGGIAWLDLGEKNIQEVMHEFRQMQVSPEYINAMNFMLTLVRMMEGLGPNQFGGGALKSETSASEVQEIGGFSRARLDVKAHGVSRWLNKGGGLFLSMVFRFMRPDEIADMVAGAIDIEDVNMAYNDAPRIDEIQITVKAGQVHPETQQQIMMKIELLYKLMMQDPIVAKKVNRDALGDMINELLARPTGLKMILPDDDLQVINNGLDMLISAARAQTQQAAAPGQSNAPSPMAVGAGSR